MSSPRNGLFVAWRIFQRRTESLAAKFDLETRYYYVPWEEKSKGHKAVSYVFKTLAMLRDLLGKRPPVVFLQLPPTPVLYLVAAYCRLTGSKYVADAHNSMIYSRWLDWPWAKQLLRGADVLLVHNEDVEHYARQYNLGAVTLRDPLPVLESSDVTDLMTRHGLVAGQYVIVPWSFAPDEPIEELFDAAALLPDTPFVMTWFAEKLPQEVRNRLPKNLVLTGFLESGEFCGLFEQAGAALVLTTREGTQPSASSEAMVLGVPLVVSDLKTTRRLYQDMPVYIQNTAEGIRQGVKEALQNRERYSREIRVFGEAYGRTLDDEVEAVRQRIWEPQA